MSREFMSRELTNDQTQQLLEQLAYQSWQSRGCPLGSPEVDWQHAIQVLKVQLTQVDAEYARPQSRFDDLGNDEDTPNDSLSLSPFAASNGDGNGADRNDADNVDATNVDAGNSRAKEPKRGKRSRTRQSNSVTPVE